MAYQDSDLGTVMQAFVDKIVAAGLGFTANNCFIALNRPDRPIPNCGTADNLFICVYPLEATLNELVGGGGAKGVMDNGLVGVEIFSTVLLDPAGRDGYAITNATKSCVMMARKILKALTAQMLQITVAGTPTDILRQPLLPEARGAPEREHEIKGSIALTFRTVFDWDLTT